MSKIYLPDTETALLVKQATFMGTRLEILDLIDYANEHGGTLPVEHLYDEAKGLATLDENAYKQRIENYRNAHRQKAAANADMMVTLLDFCEKEKLELDISHDQYTETWSVMVKAFGTIIVNCDNDNRNKVFQEAVSILQDNGFKI